MIIKDISIFEKWFPNSTYTDLEKLASYFVKAEEQCSFPWFL